MCQTLLTAQPKYRGEALVLPRMHVSDFADSSWEDLALYEEWMGWEETVWGGGEEEKSGTVICM